jgi:hypothetical protein
MFIKDKKGITAMVDAMIFIVILGIAIIALLHFQGTNDTNGEASEVIEELFSIKLHSKDVMNDGDSKVLSLTDLIAASFIMDNDSVISYISEVMDRFTGRPGSYHISISYGDHARTIGDGSGIPISTASKDAVALYGDVLHMTLELY